MPDTLARATISREIAHNRSQRGYRHPKGMPEDCTAKLQLESDRLYFKLDMDDLPNERREKKWEWCERITSQSEFAVKPERMGSGKVVTVAVYKDGYAFTIGGLDLKKTVEALRSAENILRQAANN
ncbi:MAG: hypothetical protein OXF20_02105 [Gammaproteobacteria bacterium]|nr:hypothetical protein [Gammaproteobacteria bacterium]